MRQSKESIVDWIKRSDVWKKQNIKINYNYKDKYRDKYGDLHSGYYRNNKTLNGYYTSLMHDYLENLSFQMIVKQDKYGENGLYALFNSSYLTETHPVMHKNEYILTKTHYALFGWGYNYTNSLSVRDNLSSNEALNKLIREGRCVKANERLNNEPVAIWTELTRNLNGPQLTEALTAYADNGKTPLHLLVSNASNLTPLANTVFEKIGDLTEDEQRHILRMTDNDNRTFLHHICAFWDAESVSHVIEYLNKDVVSEIAEICDMNGHNFLHEAFINATNKREALPSTLWSLIIDTSYNEDMAEGESISDSDKRLRLLQYAAAMKTRENYTCLHYACRSHNVSAFKTLQSGMLHQDMEALIDFPNSKGWQPIHYASRSGNESLVKLISEQFDAEPQGQLIIEPRKQDRYARQLQPISSAITSHKISIKKENALFAPVPQSKKTFFHLWCEKGSSRTELNSKIHEVSANKLYKFYNNNKNTLNQLAHKNPNFSKIDFENEIHAHTVFIKALDYFKNYFNHLLAAPNESNYNARIKDFCQLLTNILNRQEVIDTSKHFFAKKHWFFKGYERYQGIKREIITLPPDKRTEMAEHFFTYLQSESKKHGSEYKTIATKIIDSIPQRQALHNAYDSVYSQSHMPSAPVYPTLEKFQ